ncbi:MAG TPA: xanthine dehydrogenase family protein molybdopterin-binding subunit [Solirubrobacteraceae bacterium]|jgi:carbon-monoxide dehydrogenase large subunit|nr:xanthine dehydrogenase family protein molybdopterin-binding subunit [Solirubrobacteraceae bacterium]
MTTVQQAPKHVGRSLRRKEDPRLITGRAQYVDDITIHGMLHMAVVRSPEAHARIVSIDTSAAREHPGIKAVYTGEDMRDLLAPLPHAWAPPGVEITMPERWPLARGTVNHVGDAVAMVVGEDKHVVADAAQRVVVEYEPLPVVVDVEEALKDETLVHESLGTNKTHEWTMGGGDVEAAIAEADVVVQRRIVNHRTAGAPIEPRGVIAEYRAGSLTVCSSTQVPHLLRLFFAVQMGISEDRVRCIAPEVGGGFGGKLQITAEETLCAWASKQLGRPVKWIETRSENMAASHHGRDQVDYVRMAATSDGTITAFHANIIQDVGAYCGLLTLMIPELGAFVMTGCYKIPNVRTDITGVLTNKYFTDAIRGAGRPEMTHMLEVMIDQLADELGMDRIELRRKNFIAPGDFPYETPYGITYDSGNYAKTLDRALEMLDMDALRTEQARLREQGILRGVGFSTYTEICGLAPSRAVGPKGFGLGIGLYESALIRVHPTGSVTVFTGASPHGQGHETGFAQIVADRLGTEPSVVEVIHGDTATGPMGLGTYGSRSLSIGGVAAAHAAEKLAEKCKAIVAHNLEASVDDIEVIGGRFALAGDPDQGMTLAEVAGCAYIDASAMPDGMELGLEQTLIYDPTNFVFPFGAHVCVVDVDATTGKIDVVRWIAVDDCGPAINPMLIDGQVHGGVAHGIGQALYEQVVYDDRGQLVTGTFVDYALPTAGEIPSFETDRTETPSPSNSLGVKGIGEAGTIAATPAVVNAVIDALRHEGISYIDMPLTPLRVWQALEEARGRGDGPRASEQGRSLPEQGEGSAGSGPTTPEGGVA